jgi:hypothetical protein
MTEYTKEELVEARNELVDLINKMEFLGKNTESKYTNDMYFEMNKILYKNLNSLNKKLEKFNL